MTNDVMGQGAPENKSPVVFERGGKVYANSRDVAAFFGKNHRDVTRAVENLIAQKPELGMRNFAQTPYVEPQNGQTYKTYDMDRKGFTLLTMGFTGAEALDWKIAYIDRFDAMESALKNPLAGFVIPRTLPEALRLAADQADTIERQRIELAMAAPKLDVYERIANGDGLFNLTRAAKVLHQPPHAFTKRLALEAWIYKRAGSSHWVAYQDKLYRGFLEHKTATIQRQDGTDKIVDQVMVTPKGIVKLAAIFGVQADMDAVHIQAAE